MLACLLVAVGEQFIQEKGGRLNDLSEEALHKLHDKHKHLIKWITRKSKLQEIYSQQEIDKLIKNEELVKLRNFLQVEDEEALILILIASI